ncbi:hypothetical protein [Blastopirellula retiformator]|uniref:Uncharacterized protein n=1 Tax=Blastopirellula retiformator TaxID=2527970 RepID=A0A5C5VK25_9BACT|nr:hypothetical protein [Blastopirellula retiformator]TWT38411.1 hypothetical protein Enr8_01030 [Blastopirellula retiformator]
MGDESLYDFDASFYLDDVRYQPWRRADYPPLATWADENRDRFDLLHTIEQRDRFYYPSPYLAKPDRILISNILGGSERLRHAARALQCRAMMYVGEGNAQLAWNDLRLIYLFSRLQMPQCTIIDAMTGHAIEGVAYDGMKYLLDSGLCDQQLLDQMAQFLSDFPPPVDIAGVIDTTDRWAMLEVRMRASDVEDVTIGQDIPGNVDLFDLPYDKNMTLRRINQRFDEWTAMMKIDDPAKYLQAIEQYPVQAQADLQTWNNRGAIVAATISQSVRGIYAGDAICSWTFSNLGSAKRPYFRTLTEEQLTRMAIQLSKYRLEHGEYPESLSAMDPQLKAADLHDICAPGEDLIYERRADGGFLLYSRFENALDDQGTSWFGEIFRGDWTAPGEDLEIDGEFVSVTDEDIDLVLRFPLPGPPPLAKPKSKAEEEAEMKAMFGEDFEMEID